MCVSKDWLRETGGRKRRDEEWRRCVTRDEKVAESTSWEVMNEMGDDARRSEAKDNNERERGDGKERVREADETSDVTDGEEEWGKGGKGIEMAGGWFWQTRQQQWQREEAVQEAARQQQRKQMSQQQRQQGEVEQEAVRQKQEDVAQESAWQRPREKDEAAEEGREQWQKMGREGVAKDEDRRRQKEQGDEKWRSREEEETAKEKEKRQRQVREQEDQERREEKEKVVMEERQRIQPATIVGFGKYCGRACEWVHNQDRQYCERISRQE